MQLVSILTALILFLLAGIHCYWSFGGSRGLDKAVPEVAGKPLFRPGPGITLAVALGLTGFGLVAYLLGTVDRGQFPLVGGLQVAGWLLAGLFFLRSVGDFSTVGFFKKLRTTEFAGYDTRLYSPLCLLLAVAFVVLVRYGG